MFLYGLSCVTVGLLLALFPKVIGWPKLTGGFGCVLALVGGMFVMAALLGIMLPS
jgi:hypothetical protein